MAHIEDTLCPHFTGHVGPVRFRRGHAETDDADLVDYFREQPERYTVTETDEPMTDAELEDEFRQIARGMRDDQDDDPQE